MQVPCLRIVGNFENEVTIAMPIFRRVPHPARIGAVKYHGSLVKVVEIIQVNHGSLLCLWYCPFGAGQRKTCRQLLDGSGCRFGRNLLLQLPPNFASFPCPLSAKLMSPTFACGSQRAISRRFFLCDRPNHGRTRAGH